MVGTTKQRQQFLGLQYSPEQNYFKKLQDTVCVHQVGVPLWGTDMSAIKVSTRNQHS